MQLDGSASTSGPNIVYGWTGPNGFMSDQQNPTVCDPGNYMLTVVDESNNCPSTPSSVMVGGAPASTAAITASTTTIDCNAASATLDGSGSTNASTYTWTDDNGMQVGTDPSISVTNPGTYTLTVDNGSGCTATQTVNITGNTTVPTATINVSNAIDCNTTMATLTADPSTGLNYDWQDANGNSLGTGSSIMVGTAGVVNLIVTDPNNGCASGQIPATVVDNTNTITANVMVSGEIDCDGNPVTLTATSSGSSNVTYTWTDPNGNPAGMGTSISVTTTGTYTVDVLDPNTGCSSGAVTGIVNGNTDTPDVMASVSNDLDCSSTTATLDGTGSSTGSNFTYEWFDANGNSAGMGIMLTTMTAGSYTLVVINTDNGCDATSAPVTINENTTVPSASIEGVVNIDCNTQTVTLTANPSSGVNYNWVDASGMSLGTGSSITVTDATTVTLTTTDPNSGCESDPASVTIANNSTMVTAQVVVSGSVDCDGNPVTLSAIGVTGTNNPTYTWTDANGNVVGMDPTYSTSNTGTYTLVVEDPGSGCISDALTGDVIGNTDAPDAMASSTNDLDCNSTSTTLSASGSSTGSNFTYEWFDANGNSLGMGISITVSNSGDYTVLVTNTDNNCDATSNVVTVAQDDQLPTAVITGNDDLDCNTMSVTLDGSSSTTTGGNAITSYEWTDANGNVVSTDPTLSVTNAGDFTLNIIQSNGCGSDPVSITVDDNTTTVSVEATVSGCLLYTSPSPRDATLSRMPSSA